MTLCSILNTYDYYKTVIHVTEDKFTPAFSNSIWFLEAKVTFIAEQKCSSGRKWKKNHVCLYKYINTIFKWILWRNENKKSWLYKDESQGYNLEQKIDEVDR